MPSTPTTKSQVQAYRFVLRRMQSALVRKDAVMLHDPMRTHLRSTLIGLIAAAAGVVVFLVFGVIKPAPSLPASGIVISQQSGAVYVVTSNPRQLVPVTNMASAKLFLMAQAGSAGGSQSGNSQPSIVDEAQMQDVPRGRLTGIVGAPDFLPTSKDQLISPVWGVCDDTTSRSDQPADLRNGVKPQTTVLGGVQDLGPQLNDNQALLMQAPNNETYLVYRKPTTPANSKVSSAAVVKAKVDPSNAGVRAAYNLPDPSTPVRRASVGLLNAIPTVQQIGQSINGLGEIPSYTISGINKVGFVFQVPRTGGSSDYYVVLKDGIKQISSAVADLIKATNGFGQAELPKISLDKIAGAPPAAAQSGAAFDDYPAVMLKVLDTTQAPVACFSWSGKDNREQTTVTIPHAVPLPNGMQSVALGTGTADHAYLPPGHAAVVRSATSQEDFGRGPILLVSDRGVTFNIPDAGNIKAVDIAKGLGLGDQFDPAPEAILSLLPSGPALDPSQVQHSYDTVNVDASAGVVPSSTRKPSGRSGG